MTFQKALEVLNTISEHFDFTEHPDEHQVLLMCRFLITGLKDLESDCQGLLANQLALQSKSSPSKDPLNTRHPLPLNY